MAHGEGHIGSQKVTAKAVMENVKTRKNETGKPLQRWRI